MIFECRDHEQSLRYGSGRRVRIRLARARASQSARHPARGQCTTRRIRALDAVQVWAIGAYDSQHRFITEDIRELHRRWLGGIYPWAGEYRSVNLSRAGFLFAAANRVPRLMQDYERNVWPRKHLAQVWTRHGWQPRWPASTPNLS